MIQENPSYFFLRHRALTLLTVAFVGCVSVLLLAEAFARFALPEWAPRIGDRARFWAYDELLGWSHTPGQSGSFDHLDFSVQVSVNSLGLRDDEYLPETSEKSRMLVLGDSFAWGFGVEKHERFSEFLVADHPGWEVINAAMSGYGTDQQYLYLRERGLALHPDVVLVLVGGNDFDSNITKAQHWYAKPMFVLDGTELKLENYPVPRASLGWRVSRYLGSRTYVGTRLHIASLWYSGLLGRLQESNDEAARARSEVAGAAVTQRLIGAIDSVSRENGAKLVVVSIPMAAKRKSVLTEVTDREKIPYLSLNAAFLENDEETTLPRDGHWNPRGHQVAAEAISTFLQEQAIF